jgi:Putative zinc-finger
MDHGEAIRQKATEKYLLDELEPQVRDEFEEHLFDCQECAVDVRAAAAFIEQSKIAIAGSREAVPARVPVRETPKANWFERFRLAWAVPVFALLLVVVGYQALSNHHLEEALNSPQVLPSFAVNVSARRGEPVPIALHEGQLFLLHLRISSPETFSTYIASLYSASEKLQWSVPIPAVAGEDLYTLKVSAAGLQSGTYTLKVKGITSSGQSKDVELPTPINVQVDR